MEPHFNARPNDWDSAKEHPKRNVRAQLDLIHERSRDRKCSFCETVETNAKIIQREAWPEDGAE